MKRLYSVILLLSFLVGTLQPILPMVEYQLHEGSVIEFLVGQEDSHQAICKAELNTVCECDAQQENDDQNLLNGDYYPIAVQIATIPEPLEFPHELTLYLPEIHDISSPFFLPIPPPPRMA